MAANIVVLAIVGILLALAIRKIVVDRKNGVGSCGMNCSGCSSHGSCHTQTKIESASGKELEQKLKTMKKR